MTDNSIKSTITISRVDLKKPHAYKKNLLRDQDILELTQEESKKYGLFKIEHLDEENYYSSILVEKTLCEILYLKVDDLWKDVWIHYVFDYNKELDHGKEYIHQSAPLLRYLYVDIEEEIFYLEDMDGALYCSANKIEWFTYLLQLKNRPYYQRLHLLRKFKIPNFI